GIELSGRRRPRRLGRPLPARNPGRGAARHDSRPVARRQSAPADQLHHPPVAMEVEMKAPRSSPARRLLLAGTALGAVVLAGPGDKARAQAFDATPTTISGVVMYDR